MPGRLGRVEQRRGVPQVPPRYFVQGRANSVGASARQARFFKLSEQIERPLCHSARRDRKAGAQNERARRTFISTAREQRMASDQRVIHSGAGGLNSCIKPNCGHERALECC